MTAATTAPKRVQMSRQHPWQTEPKAIVVSRPNWLGNPYRPYQHCKGKNGDWGVHDLGRLHTSLGHGYTRLGAITFAVDCYRQLINELFPAGSAARYGLIRTLQGRDIACFCPLDQPCHGDVLLEIGRENLGD